MEKETIHRINKVLLRQNQNMAEMKLYQDDAQDNTLSFRGKIIKNNYKYLLKMNQADQMIKTAKEINANMLQNNQKILKKIKDAQKRVQPHQPHQEADSKDCDPSTEPLSKQQTANQATPSRRMTTRSVTNNQAESVCPEPITLINHAKEKLEEALPAEIVSASINKSLVDIDYSIARNYFETKMGVIIQESSPETIYSTLYPLYELCGITITTPLIKKYKNCVYFGEQSNKASKLYQGFLIFILDQKIYYGQLLNEKKSGKGVEIDFANGVTYIGNFEAGKKNGQFKVIKPHQTYQGQLQGGFYHGYGQLTTEFSIYKGQFCQGTRHGRGEQQFKSGLTIEGQFQRNKFRNLSKEEPSRANTIGTSSNREQTSMKLSTLQRSGFKVAKKASEEINPESLEIKVRCDKNVEFEPSCYRNGDYQQFNFNFQEQEDPAQATFTKNKYGFRVRESPKTSLASDRKRSTLNWQPLSLRK